MQAQHIQKQEQLVKYKVLSAGTWMTQSFGSSTFGSDFNETYINA